jgi:uncharacterized integral membrane protein
MGWTSIFLLLYVTLTGLFSFLILNLNKEIISLDLLIYEIEISLGSALLVFFITGCFMTLILESIYFLRRKGNKNE